MALGDDFKKRCHERKQKEEKKIAKYRKAKQDEKQD